MATQNNEVDSLAQDIQSPDEISSQVDASQSQAIDSAPNAFMRNQAVARASGTGLANAFSKITGDESVGDPRVVQARRVQDAMQNILNDSNSTATADEDPMDRQLRQAQAVSTGIANLSPAIAIKANQVAVGIQQAKTQQALLQAQTKNAEGTETERSQKALIERQGQVYQTFGMRKGKNGIPEYVDVGDPVKLYNDDGTVNKDFNTQIAKNLADSKAQGLENGQYQTMDKLAGNKQILAAYKMDQALKTQQMKADRQAATGMDDLGMRANAASYAIDPKTIPMKDRPMYNSFLAHHGLFQSDFQGARAENVALMAAAKTIGNRAGNVAIVEKAMEPLGNAVENALNASGLNRTKIPFLNKIISAGATQFTGSGPEKAYALAVQGFATEYARLMSGMTGVTSDNARAEAMAYISKADSPEAVRAAIHQIRDIEVKAMSGAADTSLELVANPSKYKAMHKIQERLGLFPTNTGTDAGPEETQQGQAVQAQGGNVYPQQTPVVVPPPAAAPKQEQKPAAEATINVGDVKTFQGKNYKYQGGDRKDKNNWVEERLN